MSIEKHEPRYSTRPRDLAVQGEIVVSDGKVELIKRVGNVAVVGRV